MGRRMRSEAASIAVNARERQGFRATAETALVGIIIVASVAFVASEDFKAVAHGRRCVGIHGQITPTRSYLFGCQYFHKFSSFYIQL